MSLKPFKNLFKYPRYNYEVWSVNHLIADGDNKNRVQLKMEFERMIDELHLHSDSGDGFTFMVTKV